MICPCCGEDIDEYWDEEEDAEEDIPVRGGKWGEMRIHLLYSDISPLQAGYAARRFLTKKSPLWISFQEGAK